MNTEISHHLFSVITKSEEETISLGKKVAENIKPADIICLYGALGTGKTRIAKGICEGLGAKEIINSPTFNIVNEYQGKDGLKIYHFDFYRLKTEDDILNIGFKDYINSGAVIIIEWPEKIERFLPEDKIEIHISHTDDEPKNRWIKIQTSKRETIIN